MTRGTCKGGNWIMEFYIERIRLKILVYKAFDIIIL